LLVAEKRGISVATLHMLWWCCFCFVAAGFVHASLLAV